MAGWGATSEGGFQVPPLTLTKFNRRRARTRKLSQATVLMEATLTTISNSECGSEYIYDKNLIRSEYVVII